MRRAALERLLTILSEGPESDVREALKPVVQDRQDRARAQARHELAVHAEELQLLDGSALAKVLDRMARTDVTHLRSRLRARDPLVRWAAVQVVARRRLPWEAELIMLLDDPEEAVRQAARQALVRLSRGTDFGPPPESGKARRGRAVARWQTWLALQQGESPAVAQAGPPEGPAPAVAPQAPAPDAAAPAETALQTADPEVVGLSDELVHAAADKREEVLDRLKDARGRVHTDALALAIPRLGDELKDKARAALAERLTRMTAKTLRAKFQDDDPEIRQAAARACALKKAREHVPDLIALLSDPEPAVIQAAHAALHGLTGEDFGPDPDAGPVDHFQALARWRDWWKEKEDQGRPK